MFLKPIRRFGHYFGSCTHQVDDRARQTSGAGLDRALAVLGLFIAHLFDDRATLRIVFGQMLKMCFEVIANLFLGFGNESEAPFVADDATGRTDGIRTGIPERAQPARLGTQFVNTFFAPGQVVELLVGGLFICVSSASRATAA